MERSSSLQFLFDSESIHAYLFRMLRWLLIVAFATSTGMLAYCWRIPVHSRVNHLLLFVGFVGVAVCLAVSLGRRWWVVAFCPLILAAPFLMPPSEMDRDSLNESYLKELARLEGTRYVWGGEATHGIDCSGLPRLAMRKALLAQGFGGQAWREWARLWWQDLSAQAISEGFKGMTRPVGIHGKLDELEVGNLTPGDMAVTDNGIHLLVYFGEGRWIQADPGPGKVVVGDPRFDKSGWYPSLVSVHRWTLLEEN